MYSFWNSFLIFIEKSCHFRPSTDGSVREEDFSSFSFLEDSSLLAHSSSSLPSLFRLIQDQGSYSHFTCIDEVHTHRWQMKKKEEITGCWGDERRCCSRSIQHINAIIFLLQSTQNIKSDNYLVNLPATLLSSPFKILNVPIAFVCIEENGGGQGRYICVSWKVCLREETRTSNLFHTASYPLKN